VQFVENMVVQELECAFVLSGVLLAFSSRYVKISSSFTIQYQDKVLVLQSLAVCTISLSMCLYDVCLYCDCMYWMDGRYVEWWNMRMTRPRNTKQKREKGKEKNTMQ
jgi:hypothetical protein